MLENLLNLVKEYSGDAIVNNPAIPNERNEEVIAEATQSIQGGFQNLIAEGKLNDVLKLFSGRGEVSPHNNITQQLAGGFIQNLISKFGMDQQSANGVAASLIPIILSKLISKTNDSSDNSFNIQSLIDGFSGGKTSGLNVQGLFDKFKSGGFDIDGDGDTDLNDVIALFTKR